MRSKKAGRFCRARLNETCYAYCLFGYFTAPRVTITLLVRVNVLLVTES